MDRPLRAGRRVRAPTGADHAGLARLDLRVVDRAVRQLLVLVVRWLVELAPGVVGVADGDVDVGRVGLDLNPLRVAHRSPGGECSLYGRRRCLPASVRLSKWEVTAG